MEDELHELVVQNSWWTILRQIQRGLKGEVSRRKSNEIRGRLIESYLIQPNTKMDDGGLMEKYLNSLFIEMAGQKKGLSCLRI